ncbi:CrcB family protein [Agrococcus sp. ProA11]|uniref:fluoride efflux transporter FluC n=1 Tax=Agrococcus chionoecetis TaxID=3153752 RepID=UPI0032615970
MTALEVVAVAIAGGLGAVLRFLAGAVARDRPVRATIAVNLIASFVAGCVLSLVSIDPAWRAILVTGFCGGLSTYSAFATQAVEQLERRRRGHALATVSLTLLGGALAASAGIMLGGMLTAVQAG